MTASARKLLTAFDALPATDQHEVIAEILRRSAGNQPLDSQGKESSADQAGDTTPPPRNIEAARKSSRFRIHLPPGAEPVSETLIRERR